MNNSEHIIKQMDIAIDEHYDVRFFLHQRCEMANGLVSICNEKSWWIVVGTCPVES